MGSRGHLLDVHCRSLLRPRGLLILATYLAFTSACDPGSEDASEPTLHVHVARSRSTLPDLAGQGAPEDLIVDIGNFDQVCDDPSYFPACDEKLYVRHTLVLTAERQVPGVYSGEEVMAEQSNQSSVDSPCEYTGPWSGGGTVEVVSVSPSSLTLRLEGLNGPVDMDGEYVVDRCS